MNINCQQQEESSFEIDYRFQNDLISFENLISNFNQSKQTKDNIEVDFDSLQEQTNQLMLLLQKSANNNKSIQNKQNDELTNFVIDIQMVFNSIPIKLFIGQVPKDWQESDLKIFFEKHTSITQIEVIRDQKFRHQGCAFATFSSMSEAEKVIEFYKNKHFPNSKQEIIMKWASGEEERLGVSENSSHKLIIKNLPALISDASISNIFDNFGRIQQLKVIRDKKTSECKGHAFIKYYEKESAHLAVQNLNKQNIYLIQNKKLKVSFIEKSYQKKQKQILKYMKQNTNQITQNGPLPSTIPFEKYYYEYFNQGESNPIFYHPFTDTSSTETPPYSSLIWHEDGSCTITPKLFPCHIDFTMQNKRKDGIKKYTNQKYVVQGPSHSNIFVFHLPKQYNEKNLFELFSGYGNIISITICRKQNGESRGYGFVSFNQPYEAAHAIKELNGLNLMGKRIKVELKQTHIEKVNSNQKTLNYE
ncbi:RNA recognition motif protein (macronuclear) [Tetrahymena thermophila SB210]|uniref:RNA recognition motif protein n=1 Tax=Tetrahymena thermophila (strain SB210) TaxID=312017 RepID=I7MLP2_TETTS|nr:RNA recognition motif protein [Tetrahymena thermophila SB210]EAS02798.1 RNA recognition motif protein [Tetrahymena thermophila SB210]|eukprot:XP_001023043.1 RNA recognition motif protein [Tetrahymena thermophila SB210]